MRRNSLILLVSSVLLLLYTLSNIFIFNQAGTLGVPHFIYGGNYIKDVTILETGQVKINKVIVPVCTVLQKPELHNGCEVAALTSVLRYYGYPVTKLDLADHYLPQQNFFWKKGRLFGPNPYHKYAGNPRGPNKGFYCFPPPLIAAANCYFLKVGSSSRAKNISGHTPSQIIEQLNNGVPVLLWVTLDLSKPVRRVSWKMTNVGERYYAFQNLHVVALYGYTQNKNKVHVMDPLKGHVTHDLDAFFHSYTEMGCHGMIIK